MNDWNNDGKVDGMDLAFYEEIIENHDDKDFYNHEYDSDIYKSAGHSSRKYTPTKQTKRLPYIFRMIIAAVVIMGVGALSELLGFVLLILYVIYEINTPKM